MSREQIIAAVREAFAAEIKPTDLVQSHLYDGAAGCVAGRVADVLATLAPGTGWELVHDVTYERVRRMPVPGGWLYQSEIDQLHAPGQYVPVGARQSGWHPPIFVPSRGGSP